MEGRGEAVEWAVKMVRLPEEATLESAAAPGRDRRHDDRSDCPPDRRVSRQGRRRNRDRRLRPLRRRGRQCTREPRRGGSSRRCGARARRCTSGLPGWPSRRWPRSSRRSSAGPSAACRATATAISASIMFTCSPTVPAIRLGHRRRHRIQRAVPLCRSRGRHGLPRHGSRLPRSARPAQCWPMPTTRPRVMMRGVRSCPSTRPIARPCGARLKG